MAHQKYLIFYYEFFKYSSKYVLFIYLLYYYQLYLLFRCQFAIELGLIIGIGSKKNIQVFILYNINKYIILYTINV